MKNVAEGNVHDKEGDIAISNHNSSSSATTEATDREAQRGQSTEHVVQDATPFGKEPDIMNDTRLHCSSTVAFTENNTAGAATNSQCESPVKSKHEGNTENGSDGDEDTNNVGTAVMGESQYSPTVYAGTCWDEEDIEN